MSIVVVATSDRPRLRGCLQRLRGLETPVSFETIVVLNGCPEAEADRLADDVGGLVVEATAVNLGLAGALNHARTLLRGEFLVSMHDDAEPQAGWLEALVVAADERPEAGAVGSLVLGSDGCVQAAGWELLPDGRTRAPWTCDPPAPERFRDRIAVDYTPSCSLLVRTPPGI